MALSDQTRHALQAALANPGAYNEIKAILEGGASGDLTLGTSENLIFTGTTGTNEFRLVDNLADALSIKVTGGADLMVFVTTDSSESVKVCSAVTQKIGLWGVTPVVQPAHAAQGALTDSSGGSGSTVALIGDTTMVNQAANLNNAHFAIVTLLHAIRTALVNVGIIKGAA